MRPRHPETTARQGEDLPRRFARLIAGQDRLCGELEALADALPHAVDTLAAAALAHRLHPTIRLCQEVEERRVFPLLCDADPGGAHGAMIGRLRAEHLEDEDHALEVAETILGFVARPRRGPEADRLGFLLRALFQPLRRHAAYDRDVVLPLCRAALRTPPRP